MRVRSTWTPGGIALWLIAAIAATLVVCSQTENRETPPASPEPSVELEPSVEFDAVD